MAFEVAVDLSVVAVSMPSGVEHPEGFHDLAMAKIVVAVSMPSGVEHTVPVRQPVLIQRRRRLDALGR